MQEETKVKVERVTYLAGRNIYSHSPVLRLTLDLGKWAGKTTAEIPHLEEKLFALLPGLGSHHCSLAYPGGFRTRVREGTYLGHVLEHMILELQTVAGSRVFYGRTRESRRPGVYEIVVECPCEEGAGRPLIWQWNCCKVWLGKVSCPIWPWAWPGCGRLWSGTGWGPARRQ